MSDAKPPSDPRPETPLDGDAPVDADATSTDAPTEQPAPATTEAVESDKPDAAQTPQSWATTAIGQTFRAIGAKFGLAWIGVIAVCAVLGPFIANSQPILARTTDGWESPLLRHLTAADVCFLFGFTSCLIIGFTKRMTAEARLVLMLVLVTALSMVVAYPTAMDTLQGWYLSKPGAENLESEVRQTAEMYRDLSHGSALLGMKALIAIVGAAAFALVLYRVQTPNKLGKQIILAWALLMLGGMVVWTVRPPVVVVHEEYREKLASGEVLEVYWTPLRFSPTDRLRDQFNPDNPHPRKPVLSEPTASDPEGAWWIRHPMGTDRSGADVFSGMIHASRIALSVGFIAEGIALIIGVTLGALMGYFAGPIDLIGMRLVEIFSSIPRLYLLLTFVAFFGRNIYMIMVIIGLTSWTGYTLYTRAEFLRLRKQDFVQAAEALGVPSMRLMFRHMLPNGMAPVLVNVSFGVASAILAETTLSFLGLGVVDEPSWGALLNQALSGGGFEWPLATFPGLAIFLTVFAYNLIGESMRDAIDPHAQRESNL